MTDARGRALDDRPLLGAGPEHQTSFVASANAALHEAILEEVSDGIMRLHADRE